MSLVGLNLMQVYENSQETEIRTISNLTNHP
jgi:hypothetical protein